MTPTHSHNLDKTAAPKVIMIDNYDSFTYNIVQYFQTLGADVTTVRNDATDALQLVQPRPPDFFVLSPGPSTPDQAGMCLELIKICAAQKIPLLGICLGHQAIGQAFGGKIVRASLPMHGKVSKITHRSEGVFRDLPNPLEATRYHSLVIDPQSCPSELNITAESPDGCIMGVRHKTLPIEGVQFHPESVLTQWGLRMLENFMEDAARVSHTTKI